jgi:hypothetical protein
VMGGEGLTVRFRGRDQPSAVQFLMVAEHVSVQLCLFKMIGYAILFFLKKAIIIYFSL